MLEAISYEQLLDDLEERGNDDKAVGILIGNPNCEFVKNNILNKISEYHHRSNYGIDFYFPGYGAYWHDTIPDAEGVCKIDGVEWSFSSRKFCEFIDSLEERTKWEYSGETELIILNYKNGTLDFSEVLVFWLDRMVKEDVIYSTSKFFQDIFRLFKQNARIERVSDKLAFKQIETLVINIIKENFTGKLGKIYDESKYFCTRNLRR